MEKEIRDKLNCPKTPRTKHLNGELKDWYEYARRLESQLQYLQEERDSLRELLSEVSRQFQSDGIGECEPMVLLSKIEQALQSSDNVVGQSEQLVCENCVEVEVKEQGDWCDRCLGIDEEAN